MAGIIWVLSSISIKQRPLIAMLDLSTSPLRIFESSVLSHLDLFNA